MRHAYDPDSLVGRKRLVSLYHMVEKVSLVFLVGFPRRIGVVMHFGIRRDTNFVARKQRHDSRPMHT